MLTKFSKSEAILEIKVASERMEFGMEVLPGEGFSKFAALKDEGTSNGYLYVRTRAISSRINKNNDSWPSEELAKAYRTFVGRPVFVDHNNDDPKRARGVVIDARLHVEDDEKTSALDRFYSSEDAEDLHKPPTWIELLLEVDARTYPKLATAIRKGWIDATSMGANIEYSICNICANRAENPQQYCSHIKTKGTPFEVTSSDGKKCHRNAAEHCYGINFFEDSFVFDPADPTALITEKQGKVAAGVYDQENDPGDEHSGPPRGEESPGDAVATMLPNSEQDEAERVLQWRIHQLVQEGVPYEMALLMAERPPTNLDPGFDTADVRKYLQQGADPELVWRMLSKHAGYEWKRTDWDSNCPDCGKQAEKVLKEAFDDDNLFSCGCGKNFRAKPKTSKIALEQPSTNVAETEHERQLNYEPQSDMTTAPAEVDTLRKEYRCKNCKSDYMVKDPDGLLRCQTCSWVMPAHPLDNPDLSVHQNSTLREEEEERAQLPGDIDQLMDQIKIGPKDKQAPNQISPVSPINPINQMASNKGINRMKWTTVSNRASVDTFIGNKDGITFDTYKALQESKLAAKIIYPTGEESNLPFDNPIRDMVLGLRAQRHAKLGSVSEVPITIEADLKDIEEVLEIIHTAAPVTKKIINPATVTKTEEPQNGKIVSDQQQPVTSSEKEADRRRIRRSEESADGITRTEEIVEETSDSVSEYSDMSQEEPQAEEEENVEAEEEVYAHNVEQKILSAFSLAEELIELGVLEPEMKLAFVAKLEKETDEQIAARKETAELMKQTRKVLPKTAGRLPRFSSFQTEETSDESDIDDLTFEAIFL